MSSVNPADEAGVAKPVEDPELHVDPYEAAKEIRELSRQLVANGGHGGHDSWNRLADIASRNASDLGHVSRNMETIRTQLPLLRAAIEERKVTPGRAAYGQIWSAYTEAAHQIVTLVRRNSSEEINGYRPSSSSPSLLQNKLRRIHILAQSLPTITNAPLGTANNTLRAIATILKNNGYLATGARFYQNGKSDDDET